MSNAFPIKTGSWDELGADATIVRAEVFIKEQGIRAELEWDLLDATMTHVVVYDHANKPIATGRLIAPEFPGGPAKIGRMAVLKSYRRRGVGDRVMNALLIAASARQYRHIALSAQVYVTSFYSRHGFVVEGAPFDEVGIVHVMMHRYGNP